MENSRVESDAGEGGGPDNENEEGLVKPEDMCFGEA